MLFPWMQQSKESISLYTDLCLAATSALYFTFIQPLCYFTLVEGKMHFVNNFEKCSGEDVEICFILFTYGKIYEIQ